jgi:DNA-3-methyladenine glycosylase I
MRLGARLEPVTRGVIPAALPCENDEMRRCAWADTQELFVPYHDEEWGVPVHDDRLLFEMLNLEGAQAGLSWLTILKKRDGYRSAFDNFDVKKVARYGDAKRAALLTDSGIVRHRQKIKAVIDNAKAVLDVQREVGSLAAYIWQFVDGRPIVDGMRNAGEAISKAMSKDLKRRDFAFVGPTTCYAFMQAVGLVNDHERDCFRFAALSPL